MFNSMENPSHSSFCSINKIKHYGLIPLVLVCTFSAEAAQVIKINDKNVARYLNVKTNLLQSHQKDYTFVSQKIRLSNGIVKIKYSQFYQGIPIFNAVLSSTSQNEQQVQWHGKIVSDVQDDIEEIKPLLNATSLTTQLKNTLHLGENDVLSNQDALLFIRLNEKNKAELIYLISFNVEGDNVQRPYFMVNANTGELINTWDGLTTLKAEGPGGNEKTGMYYYGKNFGFLRVSDDCSMSNENVEVYNMEHQTTGGYLFKFTCPVNNYKPINGAYSPLNDAHFFGTKVIQMYKKWFALNPLDRKFRVRVHYGINQEQAFWDGQQMTLGDGYMEMYPLTSIDVMGHEVSHAVTEKYSGLVYMKQAGGINESFSDIAGETAKFYINQEAGKSNDWQMGASITKGAGKAMRYLSNPPLDGNSIDNARNYNDSLNVHFTSGVFNKAFYLLATKPNWDVKKAFSLFLAANQVYWEREATFNSAACGVVKAARDFQYDTKDVIASFKEVGVDATCG
jgi:pseudolysin/vibriolysin